MTKRIRFRVGRTDSDRRAYGIHYSRRYCKQTLRVWFGTREALIIRRPNDKPGWRP